MVRTSAYAFKQSSENSCQICNVFFEEVTKYFKLRQVRDDFASSWNNGAVDLVLQRDEPPEIHPFKYGTQVPFSGW